MAKIFLILDLQNDLCHPEGIYARHGLTPSHVPSIIPNVVEAVQFCQKYQIPIIATQLTVLVDKEGKVMGLPTTLKRRPFLEKEGFREGTWGYDLLEEIPKIDYKIRKWGLSSFHQTELDHYLRALGCTEIILAGFTTNSSVETAAREAAGRELGITTLTDCVASYSESLHHASLTNLGAFGKILSSKEWMENNIPSADQA